MAQGLGNLQPALLLRTGPGSVSPWCLTYSRHRVRGRPRRGQKRAARQARPTCQHHAGRLAGVRHAGRAGLPAKRRITAGLFKEPAAVSEPLKFGSRLEKDTGVNGLSCGTSLDLTDMPADGTYDCRYLDGHGTLHRDATLVVDGTKSRPVQRARQNDVR